ncbi:MAG: hypothetical protein AAB596_00360 [Patescibacteria group bacterium]
MSITELKITKLTNYAEDEEEGESKSSEEPCEECGEKLNEYGACPNCEPEEGILEDKPGEAGEENIE